MSAPGGSQELTTNPLSEPLPRAVTDGCQAYGVQMDPPNRLYATDPAWEVARQTCRGCPVIQVCGEWALRNPEETLLSVWAGLDPGQWAALRRTGRMPNARRPLLEPRKAPPAPREEQLVLIEGRAA